MTLISGTIPSFINGVSQQPAAVRLPSQCEEMVNYYPTLLDFLKTRPSTKHIAKLLDKAPQGVHIHIIDRDGAEQYIVLVLQSAIKVYTLEGHEIPVHYPDGRDYITTSSPSSSLRCMTINDYTFILNTEQVVKMADTTAPPVKNQALVFIKQASYATTYTIKLGGDKVFSHTTPRDDRGGSYTLSSSAIAQDLCNQINGTASFKASMVKSTLHITPYNPDTPLPIAVEDSRSNTHMSLATDVVQKFSDLPVVAPDGYVCEISGDAASAFDNYYSVFVTDIATESFGQGVWKEAPKPDALIEIDAGTMPHALVRQADGTFSFQKISWKNRLCGDDDSVPLPSFIDRKLSSLFLYRNRLGFLAHENAVMSEAGQFFNFFATTATTLIDSDPIDVAASHTKATSLYHAIPSPEGLLLFSDQTQFKLEHPTDLLSTSTVAIKPLTEFEASPHVQPQGVGKNVFFTTPRGSYANIMEYYVNEDTALSDAANITGHVPHYVTAGVHKLAASSNEDVLLVLSSNTPNEVAVYKYLWNGNEKIQSAWFKWVFGGEVLGVAFLETRVFCILQYSNKGVYLEVMDMQPGYLDAQASCEYCLDRKLYETDFLSITYTSDTNTSTLRLPYPAPQSGFQVLARQGGTRPEGSTYPVLTALDDTITIEGDARNTPLVAGVLISSTIVLSQIYLRDDRNGGSNGSPPILSGRLQLRSLRVHYKDSGPFSIGVTPLYRDTSTYHHTGRILTHGANKIDSMVRSSGTLAVPVLSKADQVTISITSSSPLPVSLVNAEWEAFYHSRSRRY